MAKNLRQKGILLLTMLCMAFLGGCSFELPTPESLITAPQSNQELMQQRQMIADYLNNDERMIVPGSNKVGNAYQYVDIDDDGKDEIIAFYASKENNFVLGFIVLDEQKGKWNLQHKITAYGTDIHHFSVQDLDNDGRQEFLLGVHTGYGSMKELYLYQLNDSGLSDVTGSDRISYDQIVLAQRESGEKLMVTASTDTTVLVGSSNIILYSYENGTIRPVYDNTFDGYCSEMRYAKVNTDIEGIYLAMRYNHYVNMLLLRESGGTFEVALEHPIPYDYEEMQGIDLFGDVNNDGIMEINSLWSPENDFTGRPYHDYVHVWLQWDGANGLQAVDAILECPNEGYRFTIPVAWMDLLYYDFYTEHEIDWTEFYYETEDRSFETAFALAAVDRLVWEQMADTAEETIVVLGNNPTLNKVYLANIKTDTFNGFALDAGRLISCLHIEGGEQS